MIVDASVGVKWLVPETDCELALALLAGQDLAAPDLFRIEVGHTLGKLYRRGGATLSIVRDAWAELDEMPLLLQPSSGLFTPAFDLSIRLGAAMYDCVYLAMAEAMDDLLVTADGRFARAVQQAGAPGLARRVQLLSELR